MTAQTKKSILFMAQLPPPVHGAALRNKSILDSKLINDGFLIHPLPLRFVDDMRDLSKFSIRKILISFKYFLQLVWIFSTKKIDLVYFTMSPEGFAFYRDVGFIFLMKIFAKKRLLHFRVKGIQQTSRTRLGRILVKYALEKSDIICLSRNHFLDFSGYTSFASYIVPNGIKIESEFLNLPVSGTGVNGARKPEILFLSNLSRKKGIPELINALQILRGKKYAFYANLVGSEWDMTYAEINRLLEDARLQDCVKLTGAKYGKEKFQYITNADLFVFPTYFELFPGVVLEAMQFGKAIVSTFEGSIPEIIDDGVNGILVEPRNSVALANGIARMLDNPELRQGMGKLAREKFFSEFTLPVFEKRMFSVFEEVLSKNK